VPFCEVFRRSEVAQIDRDLFLGDDDFVSDALHNLAFLRAFQSWPILLQVNGVVDDLIGRERIDLQEVNFRLELGEFLFQLLLPFLDWSKELSKGLSANLTI